MLLQKSRTGKRSMDDMIAGALVFTGERSAAGYRLNRMAKTLVSAAARAAFQADEPGYMAQHGCTAAEIDLVRRRDWQGMMHAGGSIYLLLKIGAATGHSLQDIGRATAQPVGV
jgi:protocatechuate 4,5-dioxygenase alpha subunit